MKRAITLGAVALCLVLVAGIAGAHDNYWTGYDHETPAGCTAGALCVYEDDQFQGRRYRFFGTNESWAPWNIDNDDQSAFNNGTSGMVVAVYDAPGWKGQSYCLERAHGYRWRPDNYGSSNRWRWGC